jgi:hypothetical protein
LIRSLPVGIAKILIPGPTNADIGIIYNASIVALKSPGRNTGIILFLLSYRRAIDVQFIIAEGGSTGSVRLAELHRGYATGVHFETRATGTGAESITITVIVVVDDGGLIDDRHVPVIVHAVIIPVRIKYIPPWSECPPIVGRIITTQVYIDTDIKSWTDRRPAIIITTISPGYPGA